MDYEQLSDDLQQSVSLRLLRSDSAPLVLSFLQRMFKQAQQLVVPYPKLLEQLELYLEDLNSETNRYPRPAREYLKQWSDEQHRFLRIYNRGEEELAELTAASEQALSWVAELHQRSFIGTESRFLQIFGLLEELVNRSTTDVETRLAQLEREQSSLQAEIDHIRATGEVPRLNATQIKERFLQANEVARLLLRDFAAVEDNFRNLAREVQEAQLRPDARKGAVLGAVLDADQQLKESDEGRSFYTFWEFLIARDKQTELDRLLSQVHEISELHELVREQRLLRQLPRNLFDAGEKIVASNGRLAEQVRRMLDERNLAERRRIRELIDQIKHAAFRVRTAPPEDEDWLELDGEPVIELPLEKQLWEAAKPVVFASQPAEIGSVDLRNAALHQLYDQFVIDESRLRRQIEQLLGEHAQLSLAEVVAHYPITQGLSELIGYLAFASRDQRHAIDPQASEALIIQRRDAQPVQVLLPLVVFRREHAR